MNNMTNIVNTAVYYIWKLREQVLRVLITKKFFSISFILYLYEMMYHVWIMTYCGKLLERREYQTVLSVSWETCMWVKKQELERCMEQLIGSRLRKEYDRVVYCHPDCLIYMLSISREMPDWISYKLKSR